MTLQEKLQRVKTALTGIDGLTVYHYWRTHAKAPYCIWAESGENRSLEGDNGKREQDAIVYVDFFTLQEFDPFFDKIQEALNTTGNYWKWTDTAYEEQTNLIHHTWEIWLS